MLRDNPQPRRILTWCTISATLAITALAFLSSGGGFSTPELAIVGAVAMDEGTDGRILVSAEILNPGALRRGATQSPTGTKITSWVLRDESDTVFNAFRNMNRRTPQRLFLGQTDAVIFGQYLARRGVGQYLDIFERNPRFRRSILLNVCDTACGLLQRPFIEDNAAATLSGLAETAETSGETRKVTINEFLRRLSRPGIEPVSMHTAGRETEDLLVMRPGEEVQQENPAGVLKQPLPADEDAPAELPPDSPLLDPITQSGTAQKTPGMTVLLGVTAFRGDRMVGFLDGIDARGYFWTRGGIEETVVEVSNPLGRGGIALELIGLESKIRARVRGEEVEGIAVTVRPKLQIAELPHTENLSDPEVIRKITRAANRSIAGEIKKTLRTVQESFKSDIYGFGEIIYRDHPRLFRRLEEDWNLKMFPSLEVDVRVDSSLVGSGLHIR